MNVKIWSPPHLQNHAVALRETILKLGYPVSIVQEVLPFDPALYILFCPQVLNGFVPEITPHYIVYNTEHAQRFLEGSYYRILFEKATQVWCHTMETIHAYRQYHPNIYPWLIRPGYLPLPKLHEWNLRPENVIFVGTMNERRWKIVKFLQEYGIDVNVFTQPKEVYGTDLLTLYRSTRIVLNLHYEDGNPLELFRIHEALWCGCHVVSETGNLKNFNVPYQDFIHFTDSLYQMVLWINYLLERQIKFNFDPTILDNGPDIKQALEKTML